MQPQGRQNYICELYRLQRNNARAYNITLWATIKMALIYGLFIGWLKTLEGWYVSLGGAVVIVGGLVLAFWILTQMPALVIGFRNRRDEYEAILDQEAEYEQRMQDELKTLVN